MSDNKPVPRPPLHISKPLISTRTSNRDARLRATQKHAAGNSWRFTKLARSHIEELGTTPQKIAALLEMAHTSMPSRTEATMRHCGDFRILVDQNGECVITVSGPPQY